MITADGLKGTWSEGIATELKAKLAGRTYVLGRGAALTSDGKGTLRVVRALGANHFLEVVAEGYLNMTTIYQKDEKRGFYPAVHSRHFGLFGEPLIAQYTGTCAAK